MSSKIRVFNIEFDRDSQVYYPGETVSGRVIVELTQPKSIKGLKLLIVGESTVKWSDSSEKPDADGHYQNITLSGHEEYFSTKFYLFGSEHSSPFELPPGNHVHPFRYQLPNHLPSSFEHRYGYVRYTVKAILNRPWKFDHEAKTAFTIVGSYDLNQRSESALSIFDKTSKNFCCFCVFPSGKFSANITIPTSGFVPGQAIPVTVDYENESRIEIEKIKVQLRQKLKFHATSPRWSSKEDEVVVVETKYTGPLSKSDDKVTAELKVPALPPSGLEYCGLIDLDYNLRVVICFDGCHCSIQRKWPIFIGTVPLMSTMNMNGQYLPSAPPVTTFDQQQIPGPPQFQQKPLELGFVMPPGGQQFAPNPMTEISGMAPMTQQPGIAQPPHPVYGAYNLPPPSYEQCTYRAPSIRDQNESMYVQGARVPFAPRYPVYNYTPMVSADTNPTLQH